MLISTQECSPAAETAPFVPPASTATSTNADASRRTQDFIVEAYHKDRRFTALFVCSQRPLGEG